MSSCMPNLCLTGKSIALAQNEISVAADPTTLSYARKVKHFLDIST